MSDTKTDEKGREILRTVYCSTPGCWGFQDIVKEPRADDGEVAVGGCRCGNLADDEEYDKWLDENTVPSEGES